MTTDNLFYVQDTRQYVGNCVLWWRQGKAGYTTKITDAHVFHEDELPSLRDTDKPWPVDIVRDSASLRVDFQDLPKTNYGG